MKYNVSKKEFLTEKQLQSLVNKTIFSREQIDKLQLIFQREFPSGKIHKNEFVNFMEKITLQKEGFYQSYDNDFTVIDTKNSGNLTFKRFVLAFNLSCLDTFEQRTEFLFNFFNLNKNEVITREDMKQIIKNSFHDSLINKLLIKKIINEIINEYGSIADLKTKSFLNNFKYFKANNIITMHEFIHACFYNNKIKSLLKDKQIFTKKDKFSFWSFFKLTHLKAPPV